MVALLHNRSLLQQLLPLAAFVTAFTIVMMILLLSMDMKGVKFHHKLNLSGPFELYNAFQDDPRLVTLIRETYLEEPSLKKNTEPENFTSTDLSEFLIHLVHSKHNGMFVETGATHSSSDTAWIEKKLGWHGLLVQPDPLLYYHLRAAFRPRSTIIQACLSPTQYPKEAIFKQPPGVKPAYTNICCFPLFSVLLAANSTAADILIMHNTGTEVQVLRTIPFDQIEIPVISVEMTSETEDAVDNIMAVNKYRPVRTIGYNRVFQLSQ